MKIFTNKQLINMTKAFEIIKKYKIEKYLNDLLKRSSSNFLPYHNFYHIMCVVENCDDIASSVGFVNSEKRALAIAAIFHDFGHSGGKLKDDENVKNAINSFLSMSLEEQDVNDLIVEIIKATEYPYVIPDDKLTIYQKVIRDADLMQTFEKNYLQQNWLGLSQELGADFLTFLGKSKEFWDNVKFHTDYAKKKSKIVMPGKFEDVDFLLKVIEN